MNKSNMLERDGEFDDNDGSTSTAPKKMKLGRENNGKRKLTHDAYTVGWVCVLRSELNASRALLDEEHERLPLAEKDDNSYLLGRMGEHDVVIAFPGSGTYGTNAAAQTATNLIRTFRNIRFGLMVGIGGGAPKRPDPNDPRNDIRLGDIVVSTPKGGHGEYPIIPSLLLFQIRPSIWYSKFGLILIIPKAVFFSTMQVNGRTKVNFTSNRT